MKINKKVSFNFSKPRKKKIYTNIRTKYEKVNPEIKKLVKFMKGTCSICGRNKSQIFIK